MRLGLAFALSLLLAFPLVAQTPNYCVELRDDQGLVVCRAVDVAVTDDHELRIVALETSVTPPNIQAQIDALDARIATLESAVSTLQLQMTAVQGDVGTLQTSVGVLQSDVSTVLVNITTLQNENTAQAVTLTDHETRLLALEGASLTLPPELARLTDCFWATPGVLPTDPPLQCHGRGDVLFKIDPTDPWPPN